MYHKPIYTVKSSDGNSFIVELSPEHRVFAAHFPGNPVLPGACIIEIFSQLITLTQSNAALLVHIKQIKFLKMIEPQDTVCVRFCFDSITVDEAGLLMTKASVTSVDGSVSYAKMSASYAVR